MQVFFLFFMEFNFYKNNIAAAPKAYGNIT